MLSFTCFTLTDSQVGRCSGPDQTPHLMKVLWLPSLLLPLLKFLLFPSLVPLCPLLPPHEKQNANSPGRSNRQEWEDYGRRGARSVKKAHRSGRALDTERRGERQWPCLSSVTLPTAQGLQHKWEGRCVWGQKQGAGETNCENLGNSHKKHLFLLSFWRLLSW